MKSDQRQRSWFHLILAAVLACAVLCSTTATAAHSHAPRDLDHAACHLCSLSSTLVACVAVATVYLFTMEETPQVQETLLQQIWVEIPSPDTIRPPPTGSRR